MLGLVIGVIFGATISFVVVQQHYCKRLNKSFWLWVDEQKIKGTICEEELKNLSNQFDEKTKGIATFHKD